ncbi:MAG: hypothetical protein WEF86_11920 [Gemmatimonadota bacterium]
MFALIGSYVLVVLALPATLSCIISYRAMALGRRCPHCGGETLRLLDPALRILRHLHLRVPVERRWCVCCGWEGMVRLPRQRTARPGTAPAAKGALRVTQTLDLRSLDLDGSAWRVMLQCWTKTGLVYGRLVFIGPSGRLWLDAVEAFSGSDQQEVLGQALSLPEPLLQKRLRRLVAS